MADFPLITYLICFDKKILTEHVKTALKIKNGEMYIERIFQQVQPLPPQEPFAIRRFLRKCLTATFPEEMSREVPDDVEFGSRRHVLFDNWAGKFLSTPRDVILLHEAVKFGWPQISESGDFFDYVWLQMMKLKSSNLYDWTRDYVCNVGAYRDGGRAGDQEPQQEAERLHQIMDKFDWAGRNYYSGLGYFLPGVESFAFDDEKRKVFNFGHGELAKFERGRRLGSPSHWRMYFAFELPTYVVTDDELNAFRIAAKDNPSQAAAMLRSLAARPHDKPCHFLDVLLDRLSGEPSESLSDEEVQGMASAFAEAMDDIAAIAGETDQGDRGIWRKAIALLGPSVNVIFLELIKSGRSINWLAEVVRDQGFSHGLPEPGNPRPDQQWLTREQLDKAIEAIVERFQNLSPDAIFEAPTPLTILFCWLQLGSETDVREFFAHAIESNEGFIKAMNALQGWANSSTRGVYHPLKKEYVAYFTNADSAKTRLENLALPDASDADLREKAGNLLHEWTDERF